MPDYIDKDLLSEIKEKKSIIDERRPFGDAHLLNEIRKFYRVGLTYSSNAIEGNSYTLSETAILLEDGLTIGGKTLRETAEVIGHGRAYDYMFSLLNAKGIKLADIMELHRLFYLGIDEAGAGKLRDARVFITGSEYIPPAPEKLPQEVAKFEKWMTSKTALSLNPVILAAELHRRLVTIHPFIDGNGRTARLAMNAVLIQNGYVPVVIPPILRNEYISLLKMSQTKETAKKGKEEFINFIASQVRESLKDFLRMLGIKIKNAKI